MYDSTHVDTDAPANAPATARKPWQTPMVIDATIKQQTRFTPAQAPYDCCYFSATS